MHSRQKTCRNRSNGSRAKSNLSATNISAKRRRQVASSVLTLTLCLSITGCAQNGGSLASLNTTASPDQTSAQSSTSAAIIKKARGLQTAGNPMTAAQMLAQAFKKSPNDEDLRRAYAIAALEAGHAKVAYKLTSQKHAPANSDPRQLSIRGAALSTLGQHDKAEAAFAAALALSPNDPDLINNLAMALVLKGDAKKAETLLRQTATTAQNDRTRHNLALVLDLQGRPDEAKKVALSRTEPTPGPTATSALSTTPAGAPAPVTAKRSWTSTVKTSLGGPDPKL